MGWSCFTAHEGGLRALFIIKWPKKIKAKSKNNYIVHIKGVFTTITKIDGVEVPNDRIIDGLDMFPIFLWKHNKTLKEETLIMTRTSYPYVPIKLNH